MSALTRFVYRTVLPIYINIPFSEYKIAIWNCANYVKWKSDWAVPGIHYKTFNLWNVLFDTRITLRRKDTGGLVAVIKKGRI